MAADTIVNPLSFGIEQSEAQAELAKLRLRRRSDRTKLIMMTGCFLVANAINWRLILGVGFLFAIGLGIATVAALYALVHLVAARLAARHAKPDA